jgi:triacylglycerol lipase
MSKPDNGPLAVMIRESLTFVDVGALLIDPVFYGVRVAPGDGKLVVIIPGFLGNDFYLQPLHNWLRRIGYTPLRSGLSLSAGCMQRSRAGVQAEIDRHLDGSAHSVALIGHSRGGALAWAIAAQMQEQVSHLVMLGAPIPTFQRSVESGERKIRLGQMTQMLLQANKALRRVLDPHCSFPSCECTYVKDVELALSPATSLLWIYGRNDLVVPQEAQMTEGQRIDVPASHVGLVYNPEVYRTLGQFFAQNNGAPRQGLATKA